MRILPRRSINAATTLVTSIRGQATCPIRRAYSFSPAAKQAPARAAGEGHRTTVQPKGQTTAVFLQTRVSLVAKSASAAAPHRASTAVSPDYERKSRVPPTLSGQSTSPSPVTRGPRRSLLLRKNGGCTERRPNKSRAVHRLVRREEDCPNFSSSETHITSGAGIPIVAKPRSSSWRKNCVIHSRKTFLSRSVSLRM